MSENELNSPSEAQEVIVGLGDTMTMEHLITRVNAHINQQQLINSNVHELLLTMQSQIDLLRKDNELLFAELERKTARYNEIPWSDR